jgi:hypothetical protein
MLRNVTQGLGLGQILWKDLSNGKWARDLALGMSGVRTAPVH